MPTASFFAEPRPTLDLSVIVPVLNEARHVERCLASILSQDVGGRSLEVLMVDGGSRDGTVEAIRQVADRDRRVRLLSNPAGRVSPALNIGLRAARGSILVRMDAHAEYDGDYLRHSVELLEAGVAEAVGGVQVPVPGAPTATARAIAALQASRLGLGGGAHRRPGYEGPASTLWLGAFRRASVEAVGGFDEALFRSEDNDFYQRLRAAGGRLLVSARIRARYVCRPTLADLARQAFITGREILPTLVRNPRALAPRHLAPGLALVMLLAAALAAGSGSSAGAWTLAALTVGYAALDLIAAISAARRQGAATFLPALAVAPLLHGCYAAGTLVGLLWAPLARRRGPRPAPTSHAG